MLSVLKRLLGQDERAGGIPASGAERPASGEYRPDLIASLRSEHRELLRLFAELEDASEKHDEVACRTALDRFTRVLQQHLLTENRHLYGWFARNPLADADRARQLDDMSADMMRIGKMLHRFISTYARATWNEVLHAQLRKDLREIGEILAHRIHEEECVLYPLYGDRPG